MKTDVVKPQDMFYNPTRFVVPLFQRPYVWSKESQWEPLWRDVVRLIEVISNHNSAATHFLGAIVIQQVQTALGSLPAWNLIDGQQRLTTLQVFLDSIRTEVERRGMSALAGRVAPLVRNPEDNLEDAEDRFKLWPTNRDRECFAAVMAAPIGVDYSTLPSGKLRDAHMYFTSAISDWLDESGDVESRARLLVAAVTDRLEIASISLDPNEDAQAIFETLNARGTPLSAADLIKNFVFQQVEPCQAEGAYLEYWAEFETPWWEATVSSGRVNNSRASLFLWQWLTARTLIDFPIREVFTQFKHYVNTVAKNIAELLPQIRRAAIRYRATIEGAQNPIGPLSRVELFGYRVGTLDSEIARPILIWLDESEQDEVPEEERKRFLEVLESWFVRRALVKEQSQGSNRFLVDLLQHVAGQPKDCLAGSLERFLVGNHSRVGYWPGDREVRDALDGATAYTKYRQSRLRMVFEALEDHRRGFTGGQPLAMGPIVRGKASLEHLMPRKWRDHWPALPSAEQEVIRDQALHQIGNLTITTQALNSKVSNGDWQSKREHFLRHDDVLITKDAIALAGVGEWDEGVIGSRSQKLIDEILALWPAPPGHVGFDGDRAAADVKVAVDLADLVAANWLESGTTLKARPRAFRGVEAVVAQDGRVYLGNEAFTTPSGAAGVVRGRPTNGWMFWGVGRVRKPLAEVRGEYLASLGEDDEMDASDGPEEPMDAD